MPFKNNCQLNDCFPQALRNFKGFSREFTEFHAKLDAETLLDFAIHCRQEKKRFPTATVQKMCLHSTVSGGRRCDRLS
jgi:hypothetical protein